MSAGAMRSRGESRPAEPASAWLEVRRGGAPLILTFPHTGTDIPPEIERRLVSPWIGRKDADWWVHRLYGVQDGAPHDIARELDATVIRTSISRTVIDVNRDPSGASLYPGRATTELCPRTTFDGEPIYRDGCEPGTDEIEWRRALYFEPYHAALEAEIARLRGQYGLVVLYDAHSIRSRIPRLFDGLLPHFNLGTNGGLSCDAGLTRAVERACEHPSFTRVTNGRFRGGWTVRCHGQPAQEAHAIQMELACRSYLEEPVAADAPEAPRFDPALTPENWPPRFDPARAAAARAVLDGVLRACLHFARARSGEIS